MGEPAITKGSLWRHNNGVEYRVLYLANEKTADPIKYPVTVVYQGPNGLVWTRPMADWHRSMTRI
jgi:hypothetical protein